MLVVKINGVNRNEYVHRLTLTISKVLNQSWTCDFETKDTAGGYYPSVGQSVSVEIDSAVYFGGVVRQVDRNKKNAEQDVLPCVVHCTDWNHILERRLAPEDEWIGENAGDIITEIVDRSLSDEGVDTSLVSAGPVIDRFATSYPTVAAAFLELAKLAEYRLYIDAEKKLKFFAPGSQSAPFDILSSANNITKMTATETDEEYCNLVVGRVGKALRPPQPETFVGDGVTTSFQTAFPIALAPSIQLDGVDQTVGIASIDTGRQWYWSQGSSEIRQESGDTVLTLSNSLTVDYVGIEQIYVLAKDDLEIAARQAVEGGSGRYEQFIEIDRMLSQADAQAIVDAYLADRIQIPIRVNFETTDWNEPLAKQLEPGDSMDMLLDGWAAQQTDYLVRSIRATAIWSKASSDYHFKYEVEMFWGSVTKTTYQWFRDLFAGGGSAQGQRVEGDIEYLGINAGGCDVVPTGNDVSQFRPHVHNNGWLFAVSIQFKTPPSTAAFQGDIKITSDGTTWNSIFVGGSFTIPIGWIPPIFFTNLSQAGSAIQKGQWFRLDVTQAGGAIGLTAKMAARPRTGRVGTTLFDDSRGTGVEGVDESTEALLLFF